MSGRVEGDTRIDRIRNDDIREAMGTKGNGGHDEGEAEKVEGEARWNGWRQNGAVGV